MDVTGAILAGGKSTRMGRDKALIPVGETTLLAHVYDVARSVFRRIILVSSYHTSAPGIDADVIGDIYPRPGPLTGIASALLYADTPYVFVLACDMPFLKKEAIEYVVGAARGEDIVVPRIKEGYEPLHALYKRSCLSPLLTSVERGRMKIYEIFPLVTTRVIENDALFFSRGVSIFTNVNTEEDLSRARSLVGKA
jgi:molybdenum cofactor guanylyltransferase